MRIKISCLSIIAIFAYSTTILGEELTIYGSRIAANVLLTPYKKALEQKAGLKVVIEEKNCGKSLCDLVEGKCDVALTVGDLNATIDAARKWDRDIESTNLFYHPIVNDDVAFFVNALNIVDKLSSAQIKDILTGKITNWKDVGGDDALIEVYMDVTTGPVYSAIKTSLFDNQDHTFNCVRVSSVSQSIDYAMKNKGALGVAPLSLINPEKVKIITTDKKIERFMGVITRGQSSEKVRKLLDVIFSEIKKTKSLSRSHTPRNNTVSI